MSYNPYTFGGSLNSHTLSPFLMDVNKFVPDNLESAMDLCKFLFYVNPTYVRASMRMVSHFITSLDIPDSHVSAAEKKDWIEYYMDQLKLFECLLLAGMDDSCFGNSFNYIAMPFDRVLVDRRDGIAREWFMDQFPRDRVRFSLGDMTYKVPDLRYPGSMISLPFKDKRSTKRERIKLRRIDPTRAIIMSSQYAGHKQFIWRFEETMIGNIKRGVIAEVNDTPIDMLLAIKAGQEWAFNDGQVFHMARPCISGISNYGWGLPPVLENYRAIHQLQVYRKIDEAIGQDFMIPYRIIAPAPQSQSTDPTTLLRGGEWQAWVQRLMNARKTDPTKILTLPFPVSMNQFSGDGRELVPKDNLEWHTNHMLDAAGYPAELYHGTIQLPLAPVRIRFFERAHEHVAAGYRGYVKWANWRILNHLNRELFGLQLTPPDIADSIENKGIEMQMVAGGEISRETGYKKLGITDPVSEIVKRQREDLEIEKEKQKRQAALQNELQNGSLNVALQPPPQDPGNGVQPSPTPPPAGGGAAGPAPNSIGLTPLDAQTKAQDLAQKWLSMPLNARKQDMAAVKATSPQLHAFARQLMEEMRAQGASAGRAQVSQQAQ